MSEADAYRRLAEVCDDVTMWRNFVALMPWTVHVNHEHERARERAERILSRIPTQREPSEPLRRAPVGVAVRPRAWGTRSAYR